MPASLAIANFRACRMQVESLPTARLASIPSHAKLELIGSNERLLRGVFLLYFEHEQRSGQYE